MAVITLPLIALISAGLALAALLIIPSDAAFALTTQTQIALVVAIISWVGSGLLAIAIVQPRPFSERLRAAISLVLAVGVSFVATLIAQDLAFKCCDWLSTDDLTPATILYSYLVTGVIFASGCLLRIFAVAFWHVLPHDKTADIWWRFVIGLYPLPLWLDLDHDLGYLDVVFLPFRSVMVLYVAMHAGELLRRFVAAGWRQSP